MNNWKETRKPPPSVEHLKYFKIWAISNTISSGVLILILLCLVAFLVQTAYNMLQAADASRDNKCNTNGKADRK